MYLQFVGIPGTLHMKQRASVWLFLVIVTCSHALAQDAHIVTITPGSGYETTIIVNSQIHDEYGLAYPLTYEFSVPQASSGLRVYKRYAASAGWTQLVEKTSAEFFNALEVVRFDYAAARAFISVGFDSDSDTIHVMATDGSGHGISVTFNRICRYYDDREAVVCCSADDYADWNLSNFLMGCLRISDNDRLTISRTFFS